MRVVLLIFFWSIPLISFAQVKEDLSFNKETKIIHLVLENEYNDFFCIIK